MSTRALVIGFGSIGARHARVLSELGVVVAVASRHARSIPGMIVFAEIPEALRIFAPDYIVVANETSQHMRTLAQLDAAGFSGRVLVEKPLKADLDDGIVTSAGNVFVAYNLRFHPVLKALAARLCNDRVLTVQIYAGQYLPDWRPQTDYRLSYSAHRERGGGVLRDLSHELDYIQQMFGTWRRLSALGGKVGSLEIDSDDAWTVMMETIGGEMLTLQLNYLDRAGRREVTVVGDEHSYRADLVACTLQVDKTVQYFKVERDTTYIEQHKAMIDGRWDEVCSWDQGIAVLDTIARIEQAATDRTWVSQ
ncbi:Gfo/Idh/MocA family oxidoreductase (plasmid) [Rhizobium sp. WL3]|uniref:Gfo/Idh/MocA family protein n=1 Tax=Rhizobium sp. WL3 TaxID=2603277 RepID=UPI0011C1E5AA|nr:Gfo/Idh/MocA family oxidoreductase [Rhizobium sp. WL3]QEE43661.1 Gfo/Idh/MocA family oxidoreductase [Rhizobium sp. WL3]